MPFKNYVSFPRETVHFCTAWKLLLDSNSGQRTGLCRGIENFWRTRNLEVILPIFCDNRYHNAPAEHIQMLSNSKTLIDIFATQYMWNDRSGGLEDGHLSTHPNYFIFWKNKNASKWVWLSKETRTWFLQRCLWEASWKKNSFQEIGRSRKRPWWWTQQRAEELCCTHIYLLREKNTSEWHKPCLIGSKKKSRKHWLQK